jgi:GDP-L-fucose synthase
MSNEPRIFVAGHRGLVGSALVRRLSGRLSTDGAAHIVTRTHHELELTNQAAVEAFFKSEKIDHVYLAAARVGGIHANNSYPADFIRDNLSVQTNVIDSAWRHGVKKLLFLGSSCIYPKLAPQPMNEDCLLTGPLEPTNEWYAIAKIAGLKTCQAYRRQYSFNAISVMPTNLYGPGDNFDLQNSHVLPALIRKCHEAKQRGDKELVVWGTGTPRREFMHVDDLADACVHLMATYESEQLINVGWGEDVSIAELASLVQETVGFRGVIRYDATKPDGTPRKLLDTSRLNKLGWMPTIKLADGISATYRWFCEQPNLVRS